MSNGIEDLGMIVRRFKEAGHPRPFHVAEQEWLRQCCEALRARESEILAWAADPRCTDEHTKEVAAQIKDHRDAGHYTTQHAAPLTVD